MAAYLIPGAGLVQGTTTPTLVAGAGVVPQTETTTATSQPTQQRTFDNPVVMASTVAAMAFAGSFLCCTQVSPAMMGQACL